MLFNDGKRVTLSKEQRKEIEEKFKGRFPLRFVYPKEKIKPNKFNPSRPYKPHAVWIPFQATVKTNNGIEEWRFTKTMPITKNGEFVFKNDGFYFTGLLSLAENDIEFIYYLLNICPLCKNSKYASQARMHYIELYDKRAIAKEFIEKEKKDAEMRYLVITKHTLERVKTLAKACGIDDVDMMDDNEVREVLYKTVLLDEKKYALVMTADENSEIVDTRALIKEGVDVVMKFNSKKNRWYWMNENGDMLDEICVRDPRKNEFEALIDHFAANKTDLKVLKTALKKEKLPAGAEK